MKLFLHQELKRTVNHLSVTGGRIDHGASSGNDTYMSAYNDNISSLKAVKIRDLRVFSNTSPAGGCGITLFYSRFYSDTQYTKPEQSKLFGPLAPYTYGLPSLELAIDKSPLTPLPPTLPLEPPEELELLLPEEELEDPVDFFTSLLVSFAMVIRPTEPSLARPLLLWKLLTALSVLSPKYPRYIGRR